MLRDVVTSDNTASDVWADTAYRSQANEAWLKRQSRVSRIHRKKPRGKPMPERTAQANAAKSKVRARVEHVFARQKDQMGLFIRTIGIKRAEAKITLANLAYNMRPPDLPRTAGGRGIAALGDCGPARRQPENTTPTPAVPREAPWSRGRRQVDVGSSSPMQNSAGRCGGISTPRAGSCSGRCGSAGWMPRLRTRAASSTAGARPASSTAASSRSGLMIWAGSAVDPQFQQIMRDLGLFEYWQRHGQPDGHVVRDGRLIVL